MAEVTENPQQEPTGGSELRRRIVTALLLVLVIVTLFICAGLAPSIGKPLVLTVACLVVALAAAEGATIIGRRHGWMVGAWFGVVAGSLLVCQAVRLFGGLVGFDQLAGREALAAGVLGGVICALPAVGARSRSLGDSESIIASSAIYGAFVVSGGLLLMALVRTPALFFTLVSSVAANDVAAYFVGKRLGGPRVAPIVSPKKTWSGAAGGLSGGVLVWVFVAALLPWVGGGGALAVVPRLQEWWAPFLLVVGAQLGDLAKSLLKRGAGVKDSGRLLPGHGGVLDRIDGLLGALLVIAILSYR